MSSTNSPAIVASSTSSYSSPIVFDRWWLTGFSVEASNPAYVVARAVLTKYGLDANGNPVFSPVDPPVQIVIPDAINSQDPYVQNVIAALLSNIQAYGQENHLL